MPAPYPQEFRDDVVRVARNREPGQRLSAIAKDFGISESCLTNWMRQADVEDGARPGKTRDESSELRDARKRIGSVRLTGSSRKRVDEGSESACFEE